MSNRNGSAYADSGEIYGMALGNDILKGAAKGNDIFWQEGSVIYDVISITPTPVIRNQPVTVVVSCNKQTQHILTYNENDSGIVRTVTSIDDQPDGTRQITFTFTITSLGQRIIKVYGATQQSSAGDHRSVGYLAMPITVVVD